MDLPENTALIIIDVQKGFDHPKWGRRNNPDAEEKIAALLKRWRSTGRPVFHIRHDSLEPNSPLRPELDGNQIKDIVAPLPTEPVLSKHVNSSFIGTDLEARLRSIGINTLVITGLTTPHCVSTTTRMAGNLGFITYLVSDATAAFELPSFDGVVLDAETVHRVSLGTLQNEFAQIVRVQDILDTLIGSAHLTDFQR